MGTMRMWMVLLLAALCTTLPGVDCEACTQDRMETYTLKDVLHAGNVSAIERAVCAAPHGCLVVFDVGEVLLTREDAVLHRKYNDWVQDWAKREAPHINDEGWRELQAVINKTARMKIVSDHLIEVIKQAKRKGKVIALSKYWHGKASETSTFEEQRLASLKNVGVDFEEPFPMAAGWLSDEHQASYRNGLILTEAPLKGPVFSAFLKHVSWQPNMLVFIDDRRDQCDSIAEAADALGIPYVCLHYTEAVDNTPSLNPLIADLQLKILVQEKRWVTDEEAYLFLKQLPSETDEQG
jgi:hypothetical protein